MKSKLSAAAEIMIEFARLTGLAPAGRAPRRYLWTDAFAVCNYLELYRQMGDGTYKHLALLLVDQVHNVLGRHREDDPRSGWISGLEDQEGRVHPTRGGLRIGKTIRERGPDDALDDRLEWERDGQYYHYLTKWMHALHRVSRVTGDATYHNWAIELAKTAHVKFIYGAAGGQKRMYWKMSIDLSYPLVLAMGQHDPLDGYITYNQLQSTTDQGSHQSALPDLHKEIVDMAQICEGKSWVTDDPLGIGGLLCDAYKVAQMMASERFERTDLLSELLDASKSGLASYAKMNHLQLPADYRLAFRELGLSIGLRAVDRLRGLIEKEPGFLPGKSRLEGQSEALMQYAPLAEVIEGFWLDHSNRKAGSWSEHRDINMVMLATSLAPDGYLTL
jgi:hypothetical protein